MIHVMYFTTLHQAFTIERIVIRLNFSNFIKQSSLSRGRELFFH
jgi:hypothetical protein